MNFIGMDIHKQFTVAVVKDYLGDQLANERFDNSKDNFKDFLKDYPASETKIVIESTCVWEYIYELLDEFGYEVKLSNPVKTKAIASARIKTDHVDASTLADLLRGNLVAESYIPPKQIRRLREITRERRTFVKQTTQIKNKIHAILIKRGLKLPSATFCKKSILWLKTFEDDDLITHYVDLLGFHSEKLGDIDDKIREIANENKNAKLLMTLPGIAELRAVDLVAEIGEIERFENSSKLCSYAGLVPSVRQSGNSLRFGKLIRQSNKVLKSVFIEASWTAVRTKEMNQFGRFYRKLSKKKGKQKAICATARKMCSTAYAMLAKDQEFIIL
ncbi:MAG: IS110 family transposase [archaeon]